MLATAAVVVVFGLCFALQYFYILVNNLMYKHYQSPEHRLNDFYQKVLRRIDKKSKNKKKKDKK